MTRLIRSHRIGGRRSETRRIVPGTALAGALAASVAALAIGGAGSLAPIGAVFAQSSGTAGPISVRNPFVAGEGSDAVKLKPSAEKDFKDAARNAQAAWDALAPGQCPRPKITITVLKGDPVFQGALAAARRDVLKALLGREADRFQFVENVEGTTDKVEIDTSVTDTVPPAITVVPPSGTKVKNGQRLTIKVTAAEPSTGWQAGVKQIAIEDLDRHANLAPWDNPAPAPRPCGNAGLTQTIERSYVVPPDVPVAHLKITARDYHNPPQSLLIEYPTGDLAGRVIFSRDHPPPRGITSSGEMDVVLNRLTDGKLEGELVGRQHIQMHMPQCRVEQAGAMRAKVRGSYSLNGEAISLEVIEQNYTPPHGTCAGIKVGHTDLAAYTWPGFEPLARNLRRTVDGAFVAEGEFTPDPRGNTFKYTLRLQPASN